MNNEDTIADLKQFIAATVSQEVSPIRDDIKQLDKKLNKKIDDVAAGIGDAIDNLSTHVETRIDDHEVRITKLERQVIV